MAINSKMSAVWTQEREWKEFLSLYAKNLLQSGAKMIKEVTPNAIQ